MPVKALASNPLLWRGKKGVFLCAKLVCYLCGDAHAARNVHAEHNQRVLQVLVVVLVLSVQVEFIAEQTRVVTDTHSPGAVAHSVLVAAELAHPNLKRQTGKKATCGDVKKWAGKHKNALTHISLHETECRQRSAAFPTEQKALETFRLCGKNQRCEIGECLRVLCVRVSLSSDLAKCSPVFRRWGK